MLVTTTDLAAVDLSQSGWLRLAEMGRVWSSGADFEDVDPCSGLRTSDPTVRGAEDLSGPANGHRLPMDIGMLCWWRSARRGPVAYHVPGSANPLSARTVLVARNLESARGRIGGVGIDGIAGKMARGGEGREIWRASAHRKKWARVPSSPRRIPKAGCNPVSQTFTAPGCRGVGPNRVPRRTHSNRL